MADYLQAALQERGVREDATNFDAASRDDEQQAPRGRRHAATLAALEEYDRSGVSYPLDDVLFEVRADLESRLASKA